LSRDVTWERLLQLKAIYQQTEKPKVRAMEARARESESKRERHLVAEFAGLSHTHTHTFLSTLSPPRAISGGASLAPLSLDVLNALSLPLID